MLYTEKEKYEIERVRKVFEKHIQQMTAYDLVWSDKVGYVWLAISIDPVYIDTGNWIESAAGLCYECLNDIALDVFGMTGNDHDFEDADPLELAEEQYKLARKYLGGGTAADEEAGPTKQRRDSRLSVMQPVREGEVEASTLDPRADFTVERNLGFLTAAGGVAHADTPTVRACVASTQVIRAGSTVQLRLLEAVRIDDTVIPRNTPLYGLATISGMRLQVTVSSVEYGGRIFAVEAVAYDLDGQPGLNVPNSRERTALKEALASVGQTAGTSVNVTRSAGQQVLSELARGGLQASSQYVAGKLREVKITLKANHQLLLISKQQ